MRLSQCRGPECKVRIIHCITLNSFMELRHQPQEEILLEECIKIHLSKCLIKKLASNSLQNKKTMLVAQLPTHHHKLTAAKKLVREASKSQRKYMRPNSKGS